MREVSCNSSNYCVSRISHFGIQSISAERLKQHVGTGRRMNRDQSIWKMDTSEQRNDNNTYVHTANKNSSWEEGLVQRGTRNVHIATAPSISAQNADKKQQDRQDICIVDRHNDDNGQEWLQIYGNEWL